MSIFKDTFRKYVKNQLSLREELIDIGNTNDQGVRSDRLASKEITLKDGNKITLPAGSFYNYSLNKQCIIRMTSMVDYVENINLEVGGLEGAQSFNALRGATLSQNFILEGGVLSDFVRNRGGKKEVRRVTTPRDSFPKPSQKTNLGYGDLAIGADASSDGYGIVPMPGIIDANIRTKSAYGSLREAKINFECHNRRQLEVLEMLYMRPGYMVVLEWGWTPYINNKGSLISDTRLLEDITNNRIYTNDITQQEVFSYINKLKEYHNGNYDGFLGFVKNFGFKAREDGGFSCYTELISIGEVIDSLKIPNIAITDPNSPNIFSELGATGANSSKNITISSQRIIPKGNYGLGYESINTITTNIDQTKFNEALEAGIFPQYNGLEGLMRSLNNYATFNDFSRKNNSEIYVSEFEEQALDKIFDFRNEEVTTSATEEQKEFYDSQKSQTVQLTQKAGYGSGNESRNNYLRDLVRFQSATLEEYLIKVLEIKNKSELRNYIIPIGGREKSVPGETGRQFKNTQPYIRWDAFCTIINENLISKDEKTDNPINLISDRLYDTDSPIEGITKLDPLLFTPISEYSNTKENSLLDFSCDANVCILPLQFETNTLKEQGRNIDSLAIEDSLGYIPELSSIPTNYIIGTYSKNRPVYYNGQEISLDTPLVLSPTDKVRRIGSIFLNIKMLLNIAEKNADNDEYTLGSFINDIWSEVNKVCPNHNFVLTDDKESNTVYIIDLPVDNSEVPLDLYEFIPFSNKNILRKFEYTSNVPKALSATIAIQSQDPRSIKDIDGVTFAAFNRSIKNRLLSVDASSNWNKTKNSIQSTRNNLLSKQNQLGIQLKKYFGSFFRNLKLIANDKDTLGEGNISGVLKEYQKNATYLSNTMSKTGTFTSVIPLEFNATLDGISGIVIGNMFKVQKDRLPKAYANANIGFIVFNEDQQITGQDWITNISGKMTILPESGKQPVITGITSVTYTEEEILEEKSLSSTDSETESLPEGQSEISDIKEATDLDVVYLKKIKDNSLETIDSNELPTTINGVTYERPIGLTFVRSTPLINNEDWDNWGDNVIGVFNSWKNGGEPLGTIKPEGIRIIEYSKGKVAIKPSAHVKYFGSEQGKDITFYFAKINGKSTTTIETDGQKIEYYIVKNDIEGLPTKDAITGELIPKDAPDQTRHIKVSDCTTTEAIWYNIQFSKEASELFINGWVRDRNNIRITGADDQLPNGISLADYSVTNDCWMRFDTLAATAESAIQAFIENNTPEVNDVNSSE